MAVGVAKAGLVLLLVVLSTAGTTRGAPPKPSALFGFGDSYADTGNQNHLFSPWHYPYGITWPGFPTGRYGNGHIQTDYLADKLGLPSPTPYVDIANQSIATGINFALGGTGVTLALGVLPLAVQVDHFEVILRTGVYSPSFLADSVTLISNVGNDYSENYTAEELPVVIQTVVEGITLDLTRLYELGLRNILVANLPPINCVPQVTQLVDYTSCNALLGPPITFHNELLLQSVQHLNTLPNANFIIINELDAFTHVLDNAARYGIKNKLAPCCRPINASVNCGSVDSLGNPLFTVCRDPETYVYWDGVHPVQSTWNHVVDLFYSKPGFVIGATTLESWLYSLKPSTPAPAPSPGGGVSQGGSVGQLSAAYEALFSEPDYAESVGLLQAINLDAYLAGIPDQIVTVFLPNNEAYYTVPVSIIELIYGTDKVVDVAEFHVVKGFHDISELFASAENLTTISGLDLSVHPLSNQILVGPTNAIVVSPDLYKVEGQLVIHGINGILIPPNLQ